MEPSPVCPRCGGPLDIEVIREPRGEGSICFASYVVKTCRSCGHTWAEAEPPAPSPRP